MNRRSFLDSLLKAGAGFAILPGALTYARKWAPTPVLTHAILNHYHDHMFQVRYVIRNGIYVDVYPFITMAGPVPGEPGMVRYVTRINPEWVNCENFQVASNWNPA